MQALTKKQKKMPYAMLGEIPGEAEKGFCGCFYSFRIES